MARCLLEMIVEPLTPREIQVLYLVTRGKTNKEIKEALVISPKTVERHLQNIFDKLSVSNRTQAAVWAVQHGVIIPDMDEIPDAVLCLFCYKRGCCLVR